MAGRIAMNRQLTNIITQAIDLHVHIGPEIIPRKYTAQALADTERGNIAGCVLKNHFYPTAGMFDIKDIIDIQLFGSCVLNNSVGGMNAEAIYAASLVAPKPLVVWFPTINSEQFLRSNKYEIAPEWVEDRSIRLKSASETIPVLVSINSRLLPEVKRVIEMIALVKGVLATGHIAANESFLVAKYARRLNIPVIVTHPIYQYINMPINMQKELAAMGCYIEQSYSMFSMDGVAIAKIANQIKAVGANSVVLSSDVGQSFSPSPSTALRLFCELLLKKGIGLRELETMLVKNPRIILQIK